LLNALGDFQGGLHLTRGHLNVVEEVDVILFVRLVKPAAVRTVKTLQAICVTGFTMTQ
jgi:hypothetical protein